MADIQKEIQAIVNVLKKRFNNLSAIELIELAFEILNAVETAKSKKEL